MVDDVHLLAIAIKRVHACYVTLLLSFYEEEHLIYLQEIYCKLNITMHARVMLATEIIGHVYSLGLGHCIYPDKHTATTLRLLGMLSRVGI